jgi:hypothetical protein
VGGVGVVQPLEQSHPSGNVSVFGLPTFMHPLNSPVKQGQ